jgi:DNA-directed RNA polymerase specialized sigma24 family protein
MANKRKKNTNRSSHYVDKKELIEEVGRCQEKEAVSDELAIMFSKIVDGVALKFNNLKWYGIEEDVKQDCLLLLLQKYGNFDINRGTSCFSYITTIVYNQMRYQLNKNRKRKDKVDHMTQTVRDYVDSMDVFYIDKNEDLDE